MALVAVNPPEGRARRPRSGTASASAREIAAAELRAAERERVNLSTELHDGVGQHLTGIAFLAKALANRLTARGAVESSDADQIAALTNQAIGNIRALARGLRPVGTEDNSLMVALAQLARDVNHVYGQECRFGADLPVSVASALVSHHLYRIAQEGVHNAVKHGGPKGAIRLDLEHRGEQIVLTVINRGDLKVPGQGTQRDSPGIGVASMRYRAHVIGARFSLENLRGGEVRLRVTISHERAQTLQEEGEV